MTDPLQALERALKEVNPNCDAWYNHDTYVSWADLMRAIRIAQSRISALKSASNAAITEEDGDSVA